MRIPYKEFIRRIANQTDIAQKYVHEIMEAAAEVIKEELVAGRRVNLPGLGMFVPRRRGPRSMVLRSGEAISTKPSIIVNFRPTKPLKEALNRTIQGGSNA